MGNGSDSIDRDDLDRFEKLLDARFETIKETLSAMDKALGKAETELERRNSEFNNVERRFLDKAAFEKFVETLEATREAKEREESRRRFTVNMSMVLLALGFVGDVILRTRA